ncbi:MAG: NERD domain-containing protein [Bacteroidales bacterium]|nr:NERD domain-containing protein [Bacteroidales bacterium]MBP3254811.1 NERD domain-containing protein [Bacteroidales bacterium]
MEIYIILGILVIVFVLFAAGGKKRTSTKKKGKAAEQYYKTVTYGKKSGLKGMQGEDIIQEKLSELSQNYTVFNDVYVKVNGHSVQIDHVIISVYGIFVIETKNYTGSIYGTDDAEYWSKYIHGNEYKFRNPLKQNYYHVKSLQDILCLPGKVFIPIVVFTDNVDIRCETREFVIYVNQLKSTVCGFRNPVLSPAMVNYAVNKLNTSLILDKDREKKHADSINQYITEKNNLINQGICPRCKSKLIERNGRYGRFLGCSNYPQCTFTKEL